MVVQRKKASKTVLNNQSTPYKAHELLRTTRNNVVTTKEKEAQGHSGEVMNARIFATVGFSEA